MPGQSADVFGGEKEPLWKRSLPIVGSLILVVFIFGWLLPQFIDYDAVFRAIGGIAGDEWAVLLLVASLRLIPEGWVYQASLPGINLRRGVSLFLVTSALNNVPPGGLDLVARYQMARSWGITPSGATTATVGSWFFVSYPKLLLPVIASGLLTVRRIRDDTVDSLAILGIVVTIALTILFIMAVRSEAFVLAIGRFFSRLANFVLGVFRKDSDLDLEAQAMTFRDDALSLVRRRWKFGFPAGLLAQLSQFLVLYLALRFVGLESADWVVVFAAFAVVAILGTIPIVNAPGIAEAIYIGILVFALGEGTNDQVASAVFVFRVLTWLLPIPFGGIAFSRWRTWLKENPIQDEVASESG